jgi:hypothetical protein
MLRMTRSCVWPIYSKTDEWTSLKDQFDALVHNQDLREDIYKCSLTGTFVAVSGNGFRRPQVARQEGVAVKGSLLR